MKSRKEILESTLAFDKPLSEIQKDMSTIGWDSEQRYVILKREHLLNVLKRYLNNELTAEEVREWAEELDAREDIDREKGYHNLICEIIYRLSKNPWLGLPLTPEFARKLIQEISSAEYDRHED